MEVQNYGAVGNQQIVGDNAMGIFNSDGKGGAEGKADISEIINIIEKHCTEQQKEALWPVISELRESIEAKKEDSKKSAVWIDKLKNAIAALGNIASISTAAWWPMIVDAIRNVTQR